MKTKLKILIPIIIAIIAVIIAAFTINFSPKETEAISSMMSTAQKYLLEMDYEPAIAEFHKILEIDPMNVDAYLGLAQAYLDSGDRESAVETLQKGFDLTGDERIKAMLDELLSVVGETETQAATTTAAEPIPSEISENAVCYDGHSYAVFSDVCKTWEEAEKYCEALGGYLAVIGSEEENKALYTIMKQAGYDSAYFGYSDAENEGDWQWVNGEQTNYTNWNYGEPGNGYDGENYAMFYFKWEYTWNDGDFDVNTDSGGNAFICEWDAPSENLYEQTLSRRVEYSDNWYSVFEYDPQEHLKAMSLYNDKNEKRVQADFTYTDEGYDQAIYIDDVLYTDENAWVYFHDVMADREKELSERAGTKQYAEDNNNWYEYDENGYCTAHGWHNAVDDNVLYCKYDEKGYQLHEYSDYGEYITLHNDNSEPDMEIWHLQDERNNNHTVQSNNRDGVDTFEEYDKTGRLIRSVLHAYYDYSAYGSYVNKYSYITYCIPSYGGNNVIGELFLNDIDAPILFGCPYCE